MRRSGKTIAWLTVENFLLAYEARSRQQVPKDRESHEKFLEELFEIFKNFPLLVNYFIHNVGDKTIKLELLSKTVDVFKLKQPKK